MGALGCILELESGNGHTISISLSSEIKVVASTVLASSLLVGQTGVEVDIGWEREIQMKNYETWIGNTTFTWCETGVEAISEVWFSIMEDELGAGFLVKNDSKHQSDGVKDEKLIWFALREFSSAFWTGATAAKADGGFGDNTFGAGLIALAGAITGRCCLAHEFPLNVTGHTTPGAARMGGLKVCVFAGKFWANGWKLWFNVEGQILHVLSVAFKLGPAVNCLISLRTY